MPRAAAGLPAVAGRRPGRPRTGGAAAARRRGPHLFGLPGAEPLQMLSLSLIFLIRNQETGSDSTQNIASIMIRLGKILGDKHVPPARVPRPDGGCGGGGCFSLWASQSPGSRAPPCSEPRRPLLWGLPCLSSELQPPAPPHGQVVCPPRGLRLVAGEPLCPCSLQLNTFQNGGLASPSSWGPFGAGPLQHTPALFLRPRAVGEDPHGSGVCRRCGCGLSK